MRRYKIAFGWYDGKYSHRRLFVKSFVTELSRQQYGTEHTITEDEAQAILRNQIDELSGGETAPY